MTDREKIVKGLECCNGEALCSGEKCHYFDDKMCVETLHSEAIALLKAQSEEIEELKQEIEGHKDNLRETLDEMMRYADELKAQEPRVMSLEEVRSLQDNTVVWLEDNDKADVIPAIVNHIWNSLPNVASFTVACLREVKADMLWYGVKWRCWTGKPSDEQRRAETWK